MRKSFLNSEAGSLWKSKPQKLEGKWADVIKFDPQIILFIGLNEEIDMSKHRAEPNKNYFLIEAGTPITNLKEELALSKVDSALYVQKDLKALDIKRVADKIDYYHKVMAMTDVGEYKIGWIFREEAELLVPFE